MIDQLLHFLIEIEIKIYGHCYQKNMYKTLDKRLITL